MEIKSFEAIRQRDYSLLTSAIGTATMDFIHVAQQLTRIADGYLFRKREDQRCDFR